MKRTVKWLSSLSFIVFSLPLQANTEKQKMLNIFSSIPHSKSSVVFSRAYDGQMIFSYNPGLALIPASVTKLVTSAALLGKFGAGRTFETRFYYTGKFSRGVITGDLIVVGDGDPYLVSEKLWQFAADMHHLGVRRIKGRIVIDQSLFLGSERDRSRDPNKRDSEHAYDAPITAFGVNFNTIALAVTPFASQSRPNSKPRVSVDPYPITGVTIVNKARVAARKRNNIKVRRVMKSKKELELIVDGAVSNHGSTPLEKVYRSLGFHTTLAGEYLRSFLKAQDISVEGKVMSGQKSKAAKLLYTLPSYPLSKMVRGLNKYSNNYIADVLTKRLGAEFPTKGSPNTIGSGSYLNGRLAIRDYLVKTIGLKPTFVLRNGSGLSTENRFNAQSISRLLRVTSQEMSVFPEFLSSLPASGIDGTLKKRFTKAKFRDLIATVRAKTGTLTEPVSVSSLAGYIRHPRHGLVSFAIIQNGVKRKKQPSIEVLRDSQEEALLYFLNHFNS